MSHSACNECGKYVQHIPPETIALQRSGVYRQCILPQDDAVTITRRALAAFGAAALAPAARAAQSTVKKIFAANPNATPKPPYSPAVAYGNLLFISGKASYNAPDPKDIRSCTRYAMQQVEAELKNAGSSLDKVLKVQVFLRNIEDYAAMNEIFASTFAVEPPARTTVAAILPRESLVEIDAVAYI